MAKDVQCRRCYHLRYDWCKLKRDSPDPELLRTCLFYVEATNANRIREMSDEELAEIFCRAETDGRAYGPRGKAYWLKWLRSPAGGDTE